MDLSLPERAPSMAAYHDMPMEILPFAIYLLVDLDQTELGDLLGVCNSSMSEAPQRYVRLAPEPRYMGGPLRAAFDYHLQLGRERTFDAKYFLAVTSRDWRNNGILLVALDDDDLECCVDRCLVPAKESALLLANLGIGNTGWDDTKEHFGLG